MKNYAKVLAILLTLGSTASFAKGIAADKTKPAPALEQKVSVSVQEYDNNKGLTLIASNETSEKVTVIIADSFGETIYSETLTTSPEIHRNYNLAALPNGIYSVSVSSDNYTVNKNIEVK